MCAVWSIHLNPPCPDIHIFEGPSLPYMYMNVHVLWISRTGLLFPDMNTLFGSMQEVHAGGDNTLLAGHPCTYILMTCRAPHTHQHISDLAATGVEHLKILTTRREPSSATCLLIFLLLTSILYHTHMYRGWDGSCS